MGESLDTHVIVAILPKEEMFAKTAVTENSLSVPLDYTEDITQAKRLPKEFAELAVASFNRRAEKYYDNELNIVFEARGIEEHFDNQAKREKMFADELERAGSKPLVLPT